MATLTETNVEVFQLSEHLTSNQSAPEPGIYTNQTELESPHDASELPPVDRGRHAWGCLAGAFLVEAIFTGEPEDH